MCNVYIFYIFDNASKIIDWLENESFIAIQVRL